MISFAGKHNRTKTLSFIMLNGQWLTSSALSEFVGSSPACMRTLLARWVKWCLVMQSVDSEGNRKYQLSRKGYAWLSKHWQDFPLWRWISELPADKQPFFSFLFRSEEQ